MWSRTLGIFSEKVGFACEFAMLCLCHHCHDICSGSDVGTVL